MGRLECCLLLAAMTLSLIKADEGWKRLMDLNTAQEHRSAQWARSSNHGNRVPFAPEDIAMPPPWLLPNQQPQVAFPVAQAQVRSFFDEEVVEWPPRSAKKSSQTHYVPEPSQHPQPPPQIIHTTLQPPRRQWTETAIRPVQHIRFEADRPSTSQQPQAEAKQAPAVKQRDPAAVTQHVVDLKKIPPSGVAPVDLKEPYRTVPAAEPKPEQHRRQNKQQQTASRKSAISYDSSEYDYEEEGTAVASGHQNKQIIHSKMDESEGDQNFYDESPSLTAVDATMSVSGGQDDYYAKEAPPPQRRQQFVQQFHQPESRRQPQAVSTEETDVERHQAFDYGKTIFRTQVGSGQVNRQHPHTPDYEQVQQRESGRPSTYVDETTETERQQAAKAKPGQPGVRKQQLRQQQQQPLERNTSPPEASVFETERPSFFPTNLQASPNQRQFQVGQQHHQRQQLAPPQQAGEWPTRHPAPESNRKNKPRTPYRPEEQQSPEKFVNVPKYKPSNPTVPPVQRYQEEPEDFQRDHQTDLQAPYHHQQQPYRPEEEGTNYGQPEEYHRPEENHRPEEHYRPKDHHRPKEHQQPIYDNQEVPHGKKNNVRQRRPPSESRPVPESEPTHQSNPWQTQQNQPDGNVYDPYEEQRQEPHREQHQHHESEQHHEQHHPQAHQPEETPSVAPIPIRRPPGGRPSFQSDEQFNGSENDGKGNNESDFEDSPPFVAPVHKRPQHPSPNRPRPHRPLPPPQRPKDASIVTQGLNTLKSLVGLQTTQQRLRPHHSPNPDARRPERHRQRPSGRRPPHHPAGNSFDNGGEIGRVDQLEGGGDEFDAADLSNAPVQARHNVQPVKEEPMEHRSDPDDDIQDFLPPVMSSTESSVRITAPPARVTEAPELPVPVSSTAAPEEPKSTLFPPFNKRVRPQPPSPAQTESKANAGKDSSAGQLRITSYKQRIEAMKERAKLREQLAQSKKDSESTADIIAEPVVPVSVASTSTTTARPSTTRAKIPPRMPVRRPVTASPTSTSSTTESVPVSVDKSQDTKESNYEQYKRRFKPKASSNRPVKEEEPATPLPDLAPAPVDVQEEEPSGRKNLFGKMPGSPFVRRRIQQKQQREEEERLLAEESPKPVVKEEVVEMPSVPPRPNKRIRPGQFARTTTVAPIIEPSLDDEEESGSVLASPDQWPPTSEPHISVKTETSISMPKAEEEEESAKIELVSVASVETDKDIENPKPQPIEEEQDYPTHQQQSYAFESAGQPFLDKPDLSSERVDSNVEEKEDKEEEPVPVQEKPRHSFFTMATNDPILPIEELLNIRVRDNGKDM